MSKFILKPLYKLDTKGTIRVWEGMAVKNTAYGTAAVVCRHGILDGKMQDNVREIKKGKNIGRANETSPFEQAMSEVKSKHNKR